MGFGSVVLIIWGMTVIFKFLGNSLCGCNEGNNTICHEYKSAKFSYRLEETGKISTVNHGGLVSYTDRILVDGFSCSNFCIAAWGLFVYVMGFSDIRHKMTRRIYGRVCVPIHQSIVCSCDRNGRWLRWWAFMVGNCNFGSKIAFGNWSFVLVKVEEELRLCPGNYFS